MNAPVHPTAGVGAQRLIGKRVTRKEDGRLLTGKGTFVDDVVVPGMLHAAYHRSPIARGKILSIDIDAARDLPGVLAILTAEDLKQVKYEFMTFYLKPPEIPMGCLAEGDVRYVGDPVVMVIAQDRYIAEDAVGLIVVEYEEEAPVVTLADARNSAPVHPDTESNVAQVMGIEDDEDMEEALASGAHLVTSTVVHQRIAQSPMETRGVVAIPQGSDELVVHITCQSPHMVARWLELALGLPDTSIRVIAKDVGGSFGLKNHPWREEMGAIVASMILQRPVKWIEDRLEALTACNNAREQEMTTRLALDKDGQIVAAFSDYNSNNGAYPQGADANVAVHMFMWMAYKVPVPGFITRAWYSNTPGLAAYRGPWAMESLAREALLDRAARQIGMDPVELRRKNLIQRSDLPYTTPAGLPVDDMSPAECFEKLLANFDVAKFRREQAEARKEGRYLGLGLSAYVEPTGAAGTMTPMTGELAQLRVDPTGKVTAMMSTFSQGHGTQTTMAQVIADQLGVAYEDVTVFEGDSSRGGFAPGAAGSRQAVTGGGASIKAAGLLKDKIKTVAAHLLNANPESITIENGMVKVAGAEEMTRSLREIAQIAYFEPMRLPPGTEASLEAQYRYLPPPMTLTSAAHACVVEVDVDTGFVKILRWLASEDCGTVINPGIVEGQVAGGLAQAIGQVLLEEVHYDERGNPTAATFKDYMLPAISDVPDFEYIHANVPANNEGGFRGVGEGGAIVGPPTLFNAIADALSPFGELPIALPVTPSKILDLVEGRSEEAEATPPPPAGTPEPEFDAEAPGVSAVLSGADAALAGGTDGEWAMTMKPPMGPEQNMVATFKTEGGVLTGKLVAPEGTQEFTGTAEGNRLKWEMKISEPMPMTLKYDLTVEGNELNGKCKLGMFGSAKVVGTRQGGSAPPAEAAAPAPAAPAAAPVAEAPSTSAKGPAGSWAMTMKPPMGPEQNMVATFAIDGCVLSVKLVAPEGTQEFTGTADGNRLKWEMKISEPMPMTLKYDLTIEGDELTGKCKLGMFGSAKVVGTRQGGGDAAAEPVAAPAAAEAPAAAPQPEPAAPAPEAPAAAPASAGGIDGDWAVTMKPPMGPEQNMVATFKVDGEVLTGKLVAPEGTEEFSGTVAGNRLKWEMKITNPMPMTLKYDVTIEGSTLEGKCKLGMFGSAKVVGTRA
jgi:carbon-monoxide dehydrogenase large subunit